MNKLIYLSLVGLTGNKSNLNQTISGLYRLIPQSIYRVVLLCVEKGEIISELGAYYPYLQNKIETEQIQSFDFDSVIAAILGVYKKYKHEKADFMVNLTGGTKIMSIGAFMGANLIGARIQYVKRDKNDQDSDPESDEIVEIDIPKVPIFSLQGVQSLILEVLGDVERKDPSKYDKLDQTELRRIMNLELWIKRLKTPKKKISAQLISHHLNFLEENRLIKRVDDDKNKKYHLIRLTAIGKIISSFIYS